MKTCKYCHETKPFGAFSPKRDHRDGYSNMCKPCASAKTKANQQANKAERYAYQKAWREANRLQWNARMNVATAKRRAVKLNATASWADEALIADLYEYAAIMREHGVEAEVDHIVPLQGELVCGLHTHDNLTVILAGENRSKRNAFSVGHL